MSGHIDPKAFPFVLTDLHRRGATGSLKVEGPAYQKALYFRGGRILFASSNDPRDQLGAILIESGRITPEQLDEVNAKVGPGNPLAKALSESGFVNQREIGEAARTKVEQILSDVIAYPSGSFEFEDGVLPKGAVDLKLVTERVVLAAVRRITDRNFVLRHLDGLDVVLEPTAPGASKLAELQAETAGLPEQLDGERTLKEAAARARLEEFEAAKLACALLFLGLLERSSRAAAVSAPAETPLFLAEPEGAELDLSDTARIAFDEAPTLGMGDPAVRQAALAASAAPAPPGDPDATILEVAPSYRPEAESTLVMSADESEAVLASPPFAPQAAPQPPAPEPPPAPAPPPAPPPPPPRAEPPAWTLPTPAAAPPREPAHEVAQPAAPRAAPASPEKGFSIMDTPKQPAERRADPAPVVTPAEAERLSKEDLSALDAIFNARGLEGPLEPFQKPQEEWRPQFVAEPAARSGRARNRHDGKGRRRAVAAVGALVVAGAVVAAFFYLNYLNRPAVPESGERVQAAAAPPTAAAPPGAASTAPAVPAAASPAAASVQPSATTAPAPASHAPPEAKASATPAPASPPAAPTATSRTSPPPGRDRGAPAATLAEARTLLQKGQLTEAARAFAANLRGAGAGTYSVQILVACSPETVQKALQNVSSQELYILSVNYKGRDCYRVCWGIYESEGRAGSAARSIPDYFRKGGATPKVVAASGILP